MAPWRYLQCVCLLSLRPAGWGGGGGGWRRQWPLMVLGLRCHRGCGLRLAGWGEVGGEVQAHWPLCAGLGLRLHCPPWTQA